MERQSRRGFLKKVILAMTALPIINIFGKSFEAYSKEKAPVPIPAGQTPVSETDPVASALGFHHDAKKTDFSRYPDRKKPSAKNDFCQFCAQYTPLNEGWGKCNVLTSGAVSAHGWCASWTKKS